MVKTLPKSKDSPAVVGYNKTELSVSSHFIGRTEWRRCLRVTMHASSRVQAPLMAWLTCSLSVELWGSEGHHCMLERSSFCAWPVRPHLVSICWCGSCWISCWCLTFCKRFNLFCLSCCCLVNINFLGLSVFVCNLQFLCSVFVMSLLPISGFYLFL